MTGCPANQHPKNVAGKNFTTRISQQEFLLQIIRLHQKKRQLVFSAIIGYFQHTKQDISSVFSSWFTHGNYFFHCSLNWDDLYLFDWPEQLFFCFVLWFLVSSSPSVTDFLFPSRGQVTSCWFWKELIHPWNCALFTSRTLVMHRLCMWQTTRHRHAYDGSLFL